MRVPSVDIVNKLHLGSEAFLDLKLIQHDACVLGYRFGTACKYSLHHDLTDTIVGKISTEPFMGCMQDNLFVKGFPDFAEA
jgi:hypothetical protein